MKILYIIILCLLGLVYGNAQGVELKITYGIKLEIEAKEGDGSKDMTRARKRYLEVVEEANTIEATLKSKNGLSSFSIDKGMQTDDNQKSFSAYSIGITSLKGSYFTDLKNKEIVVEKEFLGTNYLVTLDYDKYDWVLSNDKAKIDRYTCHKATTIHTFKSHKGKIVNQPVTAWYTPEIPISLGPKNYIGLPGLILTLTQGNVTLYIKKIEINPKRSFKIDTPRKGKKVTEVEYKAITSGSIQKWKSERQ